MSKMASIRVIFMNNDEQRATIELFDHQSKRICVFLIDLILFITVYKLLDPKLFRIGIMRM